MRKVYYNMNYPVTFISLLLFFFLFQNVFSQSSTNTGFYGSSKATGEVCAQNGSFMSESEVNSLVTEMLSLIGAKNRFVIVACPQLENCQATLFNGKPYILYNPDYLGRVKRLSFSSGNLPQVSGKDWETLTVLAHELGHHINNHILNPLPDATQRDRELEADESAGFIIHLMGGSLAQTTQVFALVPEKGTYTHPGRAQRIAAVQKGWNDAKQRNKKNEPIPTPNVPVRSSSEVESMVNQALKLYDTKQWAEAYYILIRPQISEIAISQFILGKLFRGGLGVSQDYTIAVKWFRSAAEQGNADAQQALAEMLNMGYGVPENSVEAVKWTRKAAEQGNRQAQYDMGAVYEYGVGGLQTNIDEAIKWYRKAAEQGHPLAKKDLKRLLEK